MQKAQGDLAGALKSYSDCLEIRDRLAKSDSGNAGWQRDLSVTCEKIGDVQKAQGNLAGARTFYSDCLRIRERLAKTDPGNAGRQHDLIGPYKKIADCYTAKERQGYLLRALESAQVLHASGRAAPADEATLNDLHKLVAK